MLMYEYKSSLYACVCVWLGEGAEISSSSSSS
jgi:hypothetical protein